MSGGHARRAPVGIRGVPVEFNLANNQARLQLLVLRVDQGLRPAARRVDRKHVSVETEAALSKHCVHDLSLAPLYLVMAFSHWYFHGEMF
ncbi:MAG: hypothetical protein KAY59_02840 [Acidobacteria bacterium]|nr:hypothetical protein [Acidobacteriota bacterium]